MSVLLALTDKDTLGRKSERLGLTQEELAKRLGKSRPMIARYESGEFPVPKTVELAFRTIEEEEKR